MTLSNGINHVALLTRDLDEFTAFYREVFDAAILFDLDEDGLRHAGLDIGGGAALHAFALPDHTDAVGSGRVFDRGHIDHLAVNVADEDAFREARRRLVARGASDGTVTDFGIVRSVSFTDPDGLQAEVALWGAGQVRRFDERTTESWPIDTVDR